MFDPRELSTNESLVVAIITLLLLYFIIKQLSLKSIYGFGSPLTILSLTILYYSIVGPVLSVWNGDTGLRNIEHRPYYIISWIGTLIYIIFFLFGYSSVSTARVTKDKYLGSNFNFKRFKKQTLICYIIGISCYVALDGIGSLAGIAFWNRSGGRSEALYEGGFAGYVQNGFDFLIVACPGLVYLLRKKQISKILGGGLLFVAFALFISSGFRWRLVIAALCSLSMWYIAEKQKVKLVPLTIGGFGFLILMGIMEVTRSYGAGLDLNKGDGKGISGYLASAFNETAVFKASGFVMESVDNGVIPNINLDPVIQSIVTPIPRIFWPSKPTGDYLKNISTLYESKVKNNGMGQAILSYGEYYMMFGWLGVILMSFLVGFFYGKMNKPILYAPNIELHPWYIIFCLLNSAYLYVVISRGYTPQQVMFYFFTVYPAWYYFKKSLNKA